MNQGMSNSAACRQAGVNRKTGQRWHYGRTVPTATSVLQYPPIAIAVERSSRFLSSDERIRIADGRGRARRRVRSAPRSAVTRPRCRARCDDRNSELASGEYRPFAAEQHAASRRARPKQRRVETNGELRVVVQTRLNTRWSSEQIAASLAVAHPDRPDMRACAETIYQAIYAPYSVLQRPIGRCCDLVACIVVADVATVSVWGVSQRP